MGLRWFPGEFVGLYMPSQLVLISDEITTLENGPFIYLFIYLIFLHQMRWLEGNKKSA